jgi:glycosyltransferase involved in cell wall biosynthesis
MENYLYAVAEKSHNACKEDSVVEVVQQVSGNCIPQVSVIIPTLNEGSHVSLLLQSLKDQSANDYEVVIVDGGSEDKTLDIAHKHDARVVVLPGHGEFISRNIGAEIAKGKFLLFTSADVIFPKNVFKRIMAKFESHPRLIALTGPGYPFDAPFLGKAEYAVYNLARYFFARLPKPLKRFSTSTNFLVVRRDCFEKTGGFIVDDINADGLMGKRLLRMGDVAFFLDICVLSSARRMMNMGFLDFNKHYLYAVENFFFFTSESRVLKAWKLRARKKHGKMHEI